MKRVLSLYLLCIESFSLKFSNRSIREIDDLITFFEQVVGVTAFEFTLPGNALNQFKTILILFYK